MSPPNEQSVVEIARELGIHAISFYKWGNTEEVIDYLQDRGGSRGPLVK